MNKWRISLLVLAVLGLTVSLADGTDTPPLRESSSSTFALISRPEDSFHWSYTCSSIAFEQEAGRTKLLTAAHCIMPHRIYALAPDRSVEWLSAVHIEALTSPTDMAVISVHRTLPVVPIGTNPKVGDIVTATGWPSGGDKNKYFGYVSRVADDLGFSIVMVYMPGLEPGMSGSGLFCNDQQAVCGIVVGVYDSSPAFGAAEPISKYRDAVWLK